MVRSNCVLFRSKGTFRSLIFFSILLCLIAPDLGSATDLNEEEDKYLSLEVDYIGENIVYLTEDGKPLVKNDLTFYIKSENKSVQNPGKIKAEATKSYIKISFDSGEKLGDLAIPENISAYALSMLRNYGNEFEIKQYTQGVNPYWKLTAKGDVFLGGESSNRIELKLSNIFSYQQPGLAAIHIEYGDVPGYKNAYYRLNIIKKKLVPMKAENGLYVGDGDAAPGSGNLQVDGNILVKGQIQLQAGEPVRGSSNDVSMSGMSDLVVPTEKAVKSYVDNRLPRGIISMWHGRGDQIPPGWALCDGRTVDGIQTPDLRGRFIVGYSGDSEQYNQSGKTGGSEVVSLSTEAMPAHSHNVKVNPAGSHQHWIEGTDANGLAKRKRRIPGETTVDMGYGGGRNADPNKMHWRGSVNTDNKGQHTHISSITKSGGGKAHENRPPYYVLAFIMKL